MAELERIANHLGDIGAICNDAAFSMMHAECGILREQTLRACRHAFGHRLMMDRIVPGGVAADLERRREGALPFLADFAKRNFRSSSSSTRTRHRCRIAPSAPEWYGSARRGSSLRRLCRSGIRALIRCPRAAALPAVRRAPDRKSRCATEGDVDARVWMRILEIQQSVALLLRAALASLPPARSRRLPT